MAKQDEDLLRFARQSRSAGSDDTVVELMRPLGIVLNQDDNGNVYVETVAPKGNAARTGKVCQIGTRRKTQNNLFIHGYDSHFAL
jgi:hypothetical protein